MEGRSKEDDQIQERFLCRFTKQQIYPGPVAMAAVVQGKKKKEKKKEEASESLGYTFIISGG